MSTTINPKEVYVPKTDELYTMTQKPIPVDSSTNYRFGSKISAQMGGSVSTAGTGLNTTKAQTKFVISNSSNARLRWDTLGLAVRCKFDNGTADTSCAHAVPSWNAIADNIESISLNYNASSVPVYNCSNHYVYDYTARLFRNYDWNVLNDMNQEIFAPITSEDTYYVGDQTATTGVGKVAVRGGMYLPRYCYKHRTGGADDYPDEFQNHQRRRYYLNNVIDETRSMTKIISFQNLFPRFPASILQNLRSIELDIVWKDNSTSCMEHILTDQASRMLIRNVEIWTDYYVLAPTTQIMNVNERVGQSVDNISYLSTQIIEKDYNSGDIMISGVRNLDSVMIFQMARGMSNTTTTTTTNGHVEGQSCGEFMLINSALGCAADTFPWGQSTNIDGVGATDITTITPIKSVQIQYGTDVIYPNQELKTINDGTDFTQLYYEYLKCLNSVAHKFINPIPYHFFSNTLPFICLRPWSNNGTHLTREGKDLIIRIGSDITTSSKIYIVLFKTQVVQLQPDSSVSVNY